MQLFLKCLTCSYRDAIVPTVFELFLQGCNCSYSVWVVPTGMQLFLQGFNVPHTGFQLFLQDFSCSYRISIVPTGFQFFLHDFNCSYSVFVASTGFTLMWQGCIPSSSVSVVPTTFSWLLNSFYSFYRGYNFSKLHARVCISSNRVADNHWPLGPYGVGTSRCINHGMKILWPQFFEANWIANEMLSDREQICSPTKFKYVHMLRANPLNNVAPSRFGYRLLYFT